MKCVPVESTPRQTDHITDAAAEVICCVINTGLRRLLANGSLTDGVIGNTLWKRTCHTKHAPHRSAMPMTHVREICTGRMPENKYQVPTSRTRWVWYQNVWHQKQTRRTKTPRQTWFLLNFNIKHQQSFDQSHLIVLVTCCNVHTSYRHEHRAVSYSLPKASTEQFSTKLHVRRTRNRYRFSETGFRYRFLVCLSWA